MASYSLDTFLPNPGPSDDCLKIRDTSGTIRFKIYNDTIVSSYVSGRFLVIKMSPDSKPVKLDFDSSTIASQAIVKLNEVLKLL